MLVDLSQYSKEDNVCLIVSQVDSMLVDLSQYSKEDDQQRVLTQMASR